jgi:pteridine reductase
VKLAGRTAIVTGGAVRLGRAISLALANAGCQIVLHYGQSDEASRETAAAVRESGVKCLLVQADLLEPSTAATKIFDASVEEFGGADYLINNAAIFEEGTLANLTDDHWDRHFTINLKAAAFLSQEFFQQKQSDTRADHSHGHIINIADWRATRPSPGHLSYTLAKSALVTLTKILAQEIGPKVQVNAIAPGAILPPPHADQSYLESLTERNPLKRTGSVADVTDAVLYLLKSRFLTGELIHVSGGEQL